MTENKTKPTAQPVAEFLATVDERRRAESLILIDMMRDISGCEPVMWGPSIIGFGHYHYVYASGREGDTGVIGFSPRKPSLTIYFVDGFDDYGALLDRLGPHTHSVSCLYIKRLTDVDPDVLSELVTRSYRHVMSGMDTNTQQGGSAT